MRRAKLRSSVWTVATFSIAFAVSACGSSEDPNTVGNGGGNGPTGSQPGETPATPEEQVREILDARKTDYGEALRTASLKLRDELPTLTEINEIANAPNDAAKKAAYEKAVDAMIADPKFTRTMVKFWKDTLRTAQVGAVQQNQPNKDTAANFAAQLTVEGRSYTELFTATTNTCPTYDATAMTLTAASCTGAATGILTDPGVQAQYFANMAFRRVRFVQETFACTKFPAEYTNTPTPMGNGTYTNPWDFAKLTGKTNTPDARIDFQDTSAVICANCHNTMNRLAPLFINFDAAGALQGTPQVDVPVPGNPKARLQDFLQAGEPLAWRFGKPITDMPSLGQAIAADPDVAQCAVNRAWNYAMSRGDIVNDLATIPKSVTEGLAKDFASNGMKFKEAIRQVFKSEDFTKF